MIESDAATAGLSASPAMDWLINGQRAAQSFIRAISAWEIERALSDPATCRLHLVELAASDALKTGDDLELRAGQRSVFKGTVFEVTTRLGADGLRVGCVAAVDALAALSQKQKIKVLPSGKITELAADIFQKGGLQARVGSIQSPTIGRQIKWGKSDLAWVTDLCATYGLYFRLQEQEVRMFDLGGTEVAPTPLKAGHALFEYTVIESAAAGRQQIEICASNAADGAFHQTEEATPMPGGAKRTLVGGFGAAQNDALAAIAAADLARGRASARYIEGVCEGNGVLLPGDRVCVEDKDAALKITATVVRLRHEMRAESGFTTFFSTRPPPPPQRGGGQNVGFGHVSDSRDPEGAGRVRVTLDAFGQLETDWLNVCFAGAGQDKGFVVAPERGDQVVVAFPNDNLAQAIVIGAIYGTEKMPDGAVGSKRPRPYSLTTPDGQALRLDDHSHVASLRSKGGDLVLDPKKVRLHANTDLDISAPGRKITITASHIDFKKG